MAQNDKDLEIHYARYGSIVHKRDMVEIIEEQISSHQRLNLLVNNDNLGGDFYPGKEKQLHIIYTFNGILYEEKLNEGEVLSIPKLAIEVQETGKLLSSIVLAVLSLILGISLLRRYIVKIFRKSFNQIISDEGTGYSVEKMIIAFTEAGYSKKRATGEALLRDRKNKEARERYIKNK